MASTKLVMIYSKLDPWKEEQCSGGCQIVIKEVIFRLHACSSRIFSGLCYITELESLDFASIRYTQDCCDPERFYFIFFFGRVHLGVKFTSPISLTLLVSHRISLVSVICVASPHRPH